jgi:hypothetical protein
VTDGAIFGKQHCTLFEFFRVSAFLRLPGRNPEKEDQDHWQDQKSMAKAEWKHDFLVRFQGMGGATHF